MTDRALLTMGDLALRLRKSRAWCYANLRGLMERHGFPRPLPGLGKVWDPRAIDRWLDSQGGLPPASTPAAAAAAEAEEISAWEARFEERLKRRPAAKVEPFRR